jgi:putative ABC transport system substrate-binding protein
MLTLENLAGNDPLPNSKKLNDERPRCQHARLTISFFRRIPFQWDADSRATMRRREFLSLLGGTAVAWPAVARAQKPGMPLIGYISGATSDFMREYVNAFHQGLGSAGYIADINVLVEYRWAEGRNDRLTALIADLVQRRVDVIAVGGSTPGALAAKAATRNIPVVFLVGTDPVEVGLVTSLAKPGGNLTGITILNVELLAKCLELMQDLMPPATKTAVLLNPANTLQIKFERQTLQRAERTLAVRPIIFNASNPGEIDAAFEAIAEAGVQALVISGEYFFLTQRDVLVALAARYRIPTIYAYAEFTETGGLMSYGTNNFDAHRRVGVNTGRVLRGELPVNLPVEQITKVEMEINLKTASTLGIKFPLAMLGRADKIIE